MVSLQPPTGGVIRYRLRMVITGEGSAEASVAGEGRLTVSHTGQRRDTEGGSDAAVAVVEFGVIHDIELIFRADIGEKFDTFQRKDDTLSLVQTADRNAEVTELLQTNRRIVGLTQQAEDLIVVVDPFEHVEIISTAGIDDLIIQSHRASIFNDRRASQELRGRSIGSSVSVVFLEHTAEVDILAVLVPGTENALDAGDAIAADGDVEAEDGFSASLFKNLFGLERSFHIHRGTVAGGIGVDHQIADVHAFFAVDGHIRTSPKAVSDERLGGDGNRGRQHDHGRDMRNDTRDVNHGLDRFHGRHHVAEIVHRVDTHELGVTSYRKQDGVRIRLDVVFFGRWAVLFRKTDQEADVVTFGESERADGADILTIDLRFGGDDHRDIAVRDVERVGVDKVVVLIMHGFDGVVDRVGAKFSAIIAGFVDHETSDDGSVCTAVVGLESIDDFVDFVRRGAFGQAN